MIQGLRRKLTAFNTAVTGAILLGMTLLCLFVSERDTRMQTFQAFSDNLATISAYLEEQSHISLAWLQKMEGGGKQFLSIQDGGTPLYSAALSSTRNLRAGEFEETKRRAREDFGLIPGVSRRGSCSFSMTGANGEGYYAGYLLLPKGASQLEVAVLFPLAPMEQSIRNQRVVVALGVLLALVLLGIFSWFFTGKFLRPIAENQRRQAQFTAAASHELRTPLAAILSAASVMEQAPPEERAHFSQIIHREGQRMTRLIGDMLTLASADSRNWEIHRSPTEPDMIALNAYEAFLPQAKETGLSLRLLLPEEDCPACVCDKDRIGQVLSILLHNALSYTPAPGEIVLTLQVGKHTIRYLVSDTGPGVPDSEKKRIFERFYRGEDSRPGNSHFGLGLCIGGEIVRLHRGRLWVEDNPGGGAVFVLELPLDSGT